MSYSVQQLASLSGVSVRTLHYYDGIGLLPPAGVRKNGYRYYEEKELLRLQQILFYRELEFPLEEIRKILMASDFDEQKAFRDHKRLILLKKERLERLLKTIDKSINKSNKKNNMKDEELYGNFSKDEYEKYAAEAKERWGQTDAYKQSQERVRNMGKDGLKKVLEESSKLTLEISACMHAGVAPESQAAQKLIARHYDGLRAFYEPNMEIYKSLAEMYVADERFKKNYERVAEGLAQYMQDAMKYYIANALKHAK
ncbi:MerR family transcriptional regulator [Candidatus Falkowbacteria bacterium]|nr:MerR family transcriptional regulator [Candidatus Falkowbacteria bacterium]